MKLLSLYDNEINLGQFDIIKCGMCDIAFTNPFPSEESSGLLYETRQSSDFDPLQNTLIDRLKDYLTIRAIKEICKNKKPAKVLDYATGNGRFALAALKCFPESEVDAIDYQLEPPEGLKNNSRRIKYYYIQDLNQNKKYDLIILRHVLEHSHHPVKLLSYLRDRLENNGMLFLEVPNRDSALAKIFGGQWKGYYVPRHIYHFSKKSLEKTILSAGLNPKIGKAMMPLMGNQIAILFGLNKTNIIVQVFGVILRPIQLIVELLAGSSTCLTAKCYKNNV
jgi:2-polyprenyl-3-methyl-5-hydroxy-6-metoxy-1,4-benzoquinol methylase